MNISTTDLALKDDSGDIRSKINTMLTDENKIVLKKLSAMINSPTSDINQLGV